MRGPLLTVESLSVAFRSATGEVRAVDDLSFVIGRGETLAIVGESGSGKSVTALSILRLVEREGGTITAGRVLLHDEAGGSQDLLRASERQLRAIRGDTVSMIFQEPMTSLNPVMTVGAQLAEVLVRHKGLGRGAALAGAREMLDRVRIPAAASRLAQYPHELSGGMRQRVMIAMALLCGPELLIADEPTTALDVTVQAEILALIAALQAELGMAVMFITHDLGIVAEIAERVVVLRHGRLVEVNAVGQLYAAPKATYTRALLAAVPRLGHEAGPGAAPASEPVVSVRGLVKRFPVRRGPLRRLVGHVHAVEDVSFDIARGETLALVGESGCGKSTTGRTLLKLIEPDAGRIMLGGQDVTALSRRDMRPHRRDVQMIAQDPYASLNPRLPAFDIVTEPLAIHEPSLSRRDRRERAASLLRRVGMEEQHLDRYPHQFSGGQRQRLGIARALSLGPKLIVADEPVSALDVSVQAQVIELMAKLQREMGLGYLFISHDFGVVERVSHRVAVMYLGEIVEIGPTKTVLGNPQHPYTRRLIESVPILDPSMRKLRMRDATELPNPFRPVGAKRESSALVEVAPAHFVRAA